MTEDHPLEYEDFEGDPVRDRPESVKSGRVLAGSRRGRGRR